MLSLVFVASLKIDHHNIRKPTTNGSAKRWQTKENILSPFTPTSVFLSSGKCRKMCLFIYFIAVMLQLLFFQCYLLGLFTFCLVSQANVVKLEVTASSQSETAIGWLWPASCSQRISLFTQIQLYPQ